ncbi:hypothetical protein [Serratia sp. Se-RSBMAAmG]|uniref:hypothetical protein n=1 Tax=Serratia sp. Se-RSBMAAmG TaxID=3043305 RepID=UPI0024AEE225|nr:hypothetical protein [Serratia sp. Se-RSBMAAmG]MDI6977135.1 hypothetical protein [Serratia sp. Se-RSBMAAmG]
MTEICNVAARLKNGQVVCAEVELPDLFRLCFDESDFLDMMRCCSEIEGWEFDLETHKPSSIVPSGAGVVFYDYKNKKLFSAQDYFIASKFPLLSLSSDTLFSEYIKEKDEQSKKELYSNLSHYICGEKTLIIEEKIIKELDKKYKIYGKTFYDLFDDVHSYAFDDERSEYLYSMFKKINDKKGFKNRISGEKIYFNKGNIFKDVYSLFIDDKTISGKPIKELNSDYYYLDVDYEDWKTHEVARNLDSYYALREYLISENLINSEDKKEWDDFINERE